MTFGAGPLRGVGRKRFGVEMRLAGRIGAGTRIEHPQQIRKRGDAADRRAGGGRTALLLQGHGRRQAIDFGDFGHAHLIEQPPGVGGDRFEIAPLGLGIEGAEGQRRLARARHAGENDQGIARNIEIDILEIVLACPADANKSRRNRFRGPCPGDRVGEFLFVGSGCFFMRSGWSGSGVAALAMLPQHTGLFSKQQLPRRLIFGSRAKAGTTGPVTAGRF